MNVTQVQGGGLETLESDNLVLSPSGPAKTFRVVLRRAPTADVTVTTFGSSYRIDLTLASTDTKYQNRPAYSVYYRYPTNFVPPPFALLAVQSRKTHGSAGTFDIAVDTVPTITGAVTVEPRSIDTGHTIVFQFDAAITMIGSVSSSTGSATAAITGTDVVVTLTGIADNSRASVSLTNLNNVGVNATVSIGFLVGDVNNTRSVNSSDISGVKARSGQTADASNFKFDVNATGAINSSDISAVKARSGLVLP